MHIDHRCQLWQLSEFWLDIPWHSGVGTRDESPAPSITPQQPSFILRK